MAGLDEDHLNRILKDSYQKLGWYTWKNKNGIIFSMKVKYGSSLDIELTEKVYDRLYQKYKRENENDADFN